MNENWSHNCEHCNANCEDRTKESILERLHEGSCVKKVIGVVSEKGGVGKSLVTSLLANVSEKNFKTAVLDADVTGPSIPKVFGIHGQVTVENGAFIPAKTQNGIKIMSENLLIDHETAPVIWRGPRYCGSGKAIWG